MSSLRDRYLALKAARGCQAMGCARPVTSLGTLCSTHHRALTTYGHPLARRPDPRAFAPYLEAAAILLHRDRDHPGIRAIVAWVEARIAEGEYRATRIVRLDPYDAHQRLNLWWAQLGTLGGPRVLAAMIAVYAYERDHPNAFFNMGHKVATVCYFLIRALPPRPIGKRSTGATTYAEKARALPQRARSLWTAQVFPTLGSLCRAIAKRVAPFVNPPPPTSAFSDF